ncbi:ABC transporter ATP-binding protein [Paradesulfitobacterium aromaticivorans]
MAKPLLKIEGLVAGYSDLMVMWDIDLEVGEGETVVMVGANGAGKTTLLNAISGLGRVKSGSISFQGETVTNMSPSERVRKGILQVPEGRKLFPGMTVHENFEMGAFLRRDSESIEQDMKWVYELFSGIEQRRNQLAGTLSGGEQQMVAIGRALMGKPKLLLIDEFSLGLAPVMVDRLVEIIRRIKNETDIGVLLVEQDVHLGLEISDRAYVLETGRITMEGIADDLLKNENIKDAFLGI